MVHRTAWWRNRPDPRFASSPFGLVQRSRSGADSESVVWHAPRGTTNLGGDHTLMKRNLVAVAVVAAVSATGACGGADVVVKPTASKPPATSVTSSPTSSPTPTIDPAALPAVNAYLAYMTAANNAVRKPRALGQEFAPGTDFTKYAFDPARGSLGSTIQLLSSQGLMMTGDPGKPRIQLQSLEIRAKPYPQVTLSDCPTPPVGWHPVDKRTGKDASAPLPTGIASPPYRMTIQVIYHQGHWGVYKTTTDLSRTCSA